MRGNDPICMRGETPIYEDTCIYCDQRGMGDPYGGVDCSYCGEHIPEHSVFVEPDRESNGFLAHCGCGWLRDGLAPGQAEVVIGEHERKKFWDALLHGS